MTAKGNIGKVNIDRVIKVSNAAVNQPSGSYQQAIRAVWESELDSAIRIITDHLVDNPDHEDRFMSYRLWIECLALEADTASIRLLIGHLQARSLVDQADTHVYTALRGLAHLEAGDFGAARVYARCILGNPENTYGFELIQRLRLRVGLSHKDPILASASHGLHDYFHWELLVKAIMLQNKSKDSLGKIIDHIKTSFPNSPLPYLLEFHKCIDRGWFAAAALMADLLIERSPQSAEYKYLRAYALYEDGDYPTVRKILKDWTYDYGDDDPEVVGLLGHCYAKLGNAEMAAGLLRKTMDILKESGLPSSQLALELSIVQDEIEVSNPHSDQEKSSSLGQYAHDHIPQNWLVKLSAHRYYELMTSPENLLDRLLRPMGSRPKIGDFCFFSASAGSENDGVKKWNVVAVYIVDSDPIWHPISGYHSVLKLVSRLPVGVPIDIEIMEDHPDFVSSLSSEDMQDLGWNFDRVAVAKLAKKFGIKVSQKYFALPKEHPYRFGVYQMDVGALELIEKAIAQQGSDLVERRLGQKKNRPTA